MIDSEMIKELRQIIRKDYAIEMTEDECRESAETLIQFLSLLTELRAIKRNGYGKNQQR